MWSTLRCMKHTFVLIIRSLVSTQTYFHGSVLQWEKRKKSFSLPTERCMTVEVDPKSRKLLCHPNTWSKNGLGAKNSKKFKPFRPYPPLPQFTKQQPGYPLKEPGPKLKSTCLFFIPFLSCLMDSQQVFITWSWTCCKSWVHFCNIFALSAINSSMVMRVCKSGAR